MSGVRDNLSGGVSRCSQISNLVLTVGFSTVGTIKASWTNPNDVKYKGVRIVYKTGGYPTSPTDGSVFYDSNDATPVSTFTKTGFTDGTTYYFRAFAYTYKNATRLYTTTTDGVQKSGVPLQIKGDQVFTSSGTFTVPYGVNSVDVFLVGGGGGGAGLLSNSSGGARAGGGGGGYTKTYKGITVTPGQKISVVVGAGGTGGNTGTGGDGGSSSFGAYTVNGGSGGNWNGSKTSNGGSGGAPNVNQSTPGAGGSDGGNASNADTTNNRGIGQGTTTRAWGVSGQTLYSGGGGQGGYHANGYGTNLAGGSGGAGGGGKGGDNNGNGTVGTVNTGGGGGGGGSGNGNGNGSGGAGGSGIVLVRWGY